MPKVKTKPAKDRPPRLSRQFLRDRQWVSDHIQELIEKYPNQWIMVYNGKVIAHGKEVWSMWKRADELGLGQPFVRFIERDVYVY
jgi:hypothetical protein